ncbi:hypothetical protein BH10ACI1_BH10ACI1_12770 [soil metagenome]
MNVGLNSKAEAEAVKAGFNFLMIDTLGNAPISAFLNISLPNRCCVCGNYLESVFELKKIVLKLNITPIF